MNTFASHRIFQAAKMLLCHAANLFNSFGVNYVCDLYLLASVPDLGLALYLHLTTPVECAVPAG